MPAFAAAPGRQLYLRAGRAIEVGSLARDVDLELLDALHRRWHDPCGPATGVGGSSGCITGRVGVNSAVHVAAVVVAIELECVLVSENTGHRPILRSRGLQLPPAGDDTS